MLRELPRGAELALDEGRLEVAIVPRSDGQWRFVAGPYTVEVTGTAFTLRWQDDRLTIDLKRGSVDVVGPRGRFSLQAPVTRTFSVATTEDGGSASDGARPHEGPNESGSAQGTSTPSATSASPAALLADAQAARLAGRSAESQGLLAKLRRLHPKSPEATTALFLEARMAFDGGRMVAARAALESYLAVAPSGAFAAEAEVLLIEALSRSGDAHAARARGKAYLAAHPRGVHSDRIRRLVEADQKAPPKATP
ncbi:MAG: tetratricopeptide repeat protein [Polyangiaceae bacterium]